MHSPAEITEFPSPEALALLSTDLDFAAWKRLEGVPLDETDKDALDRVGRLLASVAEFNMPNGSGRVFLTGPGSSGQPLVDTLQTIEHPDVLWKVIDVCRSERDLTPEEKASVRDLREIFGRLAERLLARANGSLVPRR